MALTTRQHWLDHATHELLAVGIESARLDSELLLTHALNISRTTLHAHPETEIPDSLTSVLDAMLSLRVIRVPLAYIIGHREFYGRLFKVTPSVLIPRPESEELVTTVGELPGFATILDIGTGSGALAVTLALEHPDSRIIATDTSARALTVAKTNDLTYQAHIRFEKMDLLSTPRDLELTHPLCIVANLPYVALIDERSPETHYEPEEALFAADEGLDLIKKLIVQAAPVMKTGDYLLLESNPSQQPGIIDHAKIHGLALAKTRGLVTVLRRD